MNENNVVLKSDTSVLYCFRNKITGDYIDENYDLTDNIKEAIGMTTLEKAKEELKTLDDPNEWYIVLKVFNISIIGEPIQVTKFI